MKNMMVPGRWSLFWLNFFRISLSQGKDMITLEKELEHASSYLAIQNIRFKDKFEFHVDADPELLK